MQAEEHAWLGLGLGLGLGLELGLGLGFGSGFGLGLGLGLEPKSTPSCGTRKCGTPSRASRASKGAQSSKSRPTW